MIHGPKYMREDIVKARKKQNTNRDDLTKNYNTYLKWYTNNTMRKIELNYSNIV